MTAFLTTGKVDVGVDALQVAVQHGSCVSARAVLNGTWDADELHQEGCVFCHFVWCLMADYEAQPNARSPE